MYNKSRLSEEEIKAMREKYKDPEAMKESVDRLAEKLAGKIIDREIEHE